MTPDAVLRRMSREEKVALPESKLADLLSIKATDVESIEEFERNLSILKDAGDICRWAVKGKAVVTLSSISAYRFRLRLNPSSTKWVEHGSRDPKDANKARVTAAGARIMCEADMTEEPPGQLDNIVDTKNEIEDDPDPHRARALRWEAKMGLIRPTLPLVGIQPWTAGNWERAPDAHVCDPLDDPRRVAEPGDDKKRRRMTPEKLRAIKPTTEDCPVCNGRPLRSMIGLAPMKIGKNRATRPPEVQEGGEFCCKCSRHYQDQIWPRVFRITNDDTSTGGNGKVTG